MSEGDDVSTSTPPAWKWRDECSVPVTTAPCPDCGRRHKPWVLCHEYEEARSDPTGEDAWPLERDGVQSVRETPTKLRVGARNEHPESPSMPDTASSGDVAGSDDEPHHIPFKTQEFMFEELCEEKLAELPHLIFTHAERIIEMARDRFRKGYARFGSEMYSWTPERRLDETLQELADAVVYPTSGPME